MQIAEGTAMFEPAIGDEFEQRGTAIVAHTGDGVGRDGVDGLDRLAVVLRTS